MQEKACAGGAVYTEERGGISAVWEYADTISLKMEKKFAKKSCRLKRAAAFLIKSGNGMDRGTVAVKIYALIQTAYTVQQEAHQ